MKRLAGNSSDIESVLREYPAVDDAVIVLRKDLPVGAALIGYYVAVTPVEPTQLREHLAVRLPSFMVPAAFVALAPFGLAPFRPTLSGSTKPVQVT